MGAINFAKDNGIILLTIPPHTSNKLQPLDCAIYGPLKSYYNSACDNWMLNHPGRTLTIYEIAECFGNAFLLVFSKRNIESAFRVTGIWPVNVNIFTEDDFLSSYVTDRDYTVNAGPSSSQEVQCYTTDEPERSTNALGDSPKETQNNDMVVDTCVRSEEANQPNTSNDSHLSQPSTSNVNKQRQTLESIRPYPKALSRQNPARGRKRAKSTILTDTPEKLAIEEQYNRKKQI